MTNASKQLSFFLSRGDSLLVGGGSGGYPRSKSGWKRAPYHSHPETKIADHQSSFEISLSSHWKETSLREVNLPRDSPLMWQTLASSFRSFCRGVAHCLFHPPSFSNGWLQGSLRLNASPRKKSVARRLTWCLRSTCRQTQCDQHKTLAPTPPDHLSFLL